MPIPLRSSTVLSSQIRYNADTTNDSATEIKGLVIITSNLNLFFKHLLRNETLARFSSSYTCIYINQFFTWIYIDIYIMEGYVLPSTTSTKSRRLKLTRNGKDNHLPIAKDGIKLEPMAHAT